MTSPELFRPRGALGPAALVVDVPVRTTNPLNGSWGNTPGSAHAKRRARVMQREATRFHVRRALRLARVTGADLVPCVVVLTRISAGKMDEDGLGASLKAVRDGIADELQIDDGSRFIRFRPRQREGPPKAMSVEVAIFRADACAMWDDS